MSLTPNNTGLANDESGLRAITDAATAYWGSMVLLASNDLDVFTALASGPQSAEELSAKGYGQERPLAMLLNACVAARFLEKAGSKFRNSPAAEKYLVNGSPAYIGNALKYAMDMYAPWGKLAQTVRTNKPAVSPASMLGTDPEKTRNFVLGMHNRALGVASALTHVLDLSGRRWLLDIGGGPGTYSVMLTRRTPGLRATVLDLPDVVSIAKEMIESFGCSDRVAVMAGDYNQTAFPGGVDVVLMSGMMHRETEATCRRLLEKCFNAMTSGGLLVINDIFFEDEAKSSPPFATLFALNMALSSEHGAAHAVTEVARWMNEAGFGEITLKPLPPPNPHTVVMSTRP